MFRATIFLVALISILSCQTSKKDSVNTVVEDSAVATSSVPKPKPGIKSEKRINMDLVVKDQLNSHVLDSLEIYYRYIGSDKYQLKKTISVVNGSSKEDFTIVGILDLVHGENFATIDTIIFKKANKEYYLTPLNDSTYDVSRFTYQQIQLIDYNFDGHQDISICSEWESTQHNKIDNVFLYDSKRDVFEWHEFLSKQANLLVDKKARLITTISVFNRSYYEEKVLIFKNDKFVPIVKKSWVPGNEDIVIFTLDSLTSKGWIVKIDTLKEGEY